jgi:hypothetical protein
MHALTAADVLDVWEQGAEVHPVVRPLLVLAAAFPEDDPALLAAEPLGAVNARLWQVRAALVGTAVVGCADCPACREPAEFELDGAALADAPPPRSSSSVRPIGLGDLFAVTEDPDPAAALLRRCAVAPAELADPAELAAVDPAAELLLAITCPACGHGWEAPLDVAAFLWTELARIVVDTMSDVDALARAYGWTEQDVLGLRPARRRRYVAMARVHAGGRR